jgi:hypothetical protein
LSRGYFKADSSEDLQLYAIIPALTLLFMVKEVLQPNPSEALSTPVDPDGLSLEHVKGIKVGETLLTPQMLQDDAEAFKGTTFRRGFDKLSGEQLISVSAYEKLPFKITGDKSSPEPVTLQAEVRLFPYTIDTPTPPYPGEPSSANRSIRLMPEPGGKIGKVELNEDRNIAINGITMTPDGISMEIGNGSMHAEIRYTHQDNPPPLEPPKGHKEHIAWNPPA